MIYPHTQETIELEGSVRSLTRRLITVANPLGSDEAITFAKRNPAEDLNPAAGGGGESEVRRADWRADYDSCQRTESIWTWRSRHRDLEESK